LVGSIPPFGLTQALLNANYDLTTVSAWMNMAPSPDIGVLASLTVVPGIVQGGSSAAGTVTLEQPVSTDAIVGLGATQTARTKASSTVPLPQASVPATVTVPANQLSATFPVTTSPLPAGAVSHTMTIVANAVNTKIAPLTFE